MAAPNVLILRAPGTNCDAETAFAFQQAGAKTEVLHINRLLENPTLFRQFQILCVPGGFSYGDDLGSGRILGNQMHHHLVDEMAAVQGRRQTDPGHLQRVPGVDEIARAIGNRCGGRAVGHADGERLRPLSRLAGCGCKRKARNACF